MRRRPASLVPARGFTLVELLVTLAVSGVLVALLYQIFVSQQRSHTLQEQVADAQQSGRVIVGELTRSLASLGAGADLERGQIRLLVAHPYQVVFNADLRTDHDALPPGAAVPGALASDPYQTIPPGTYPLHPGAETYRYTLDRNGDGLVNAADRTQGEHYTLYREVNGGNVQEVAGLLANPRIGETLFVYWGDFDGDGVEDSLTQVNAATSPRIAAGEPLDAVVRRVEINLVTETANPDPRYPSAGGYRQTRLRTAVSLENLWDCPVVSALAPPGPLRAPTLRGGTTNFQFRVTRGGVPEAGRTVVLSLLDPAGTAIPITNTAGNASSAITDASGVATAVAHWPASCAGVPTGTYTIRARTAEPPTLSTPFGACSPHETTLAVQVIPGLPDHLQLGPSPLLVSSCGGAATATYEFRDACGRPVRPEDVRDDQALLTLAPDPRFHRSLSPQVLNRVSGTISYESPSALYSATFPTVPRSAVSPYPFLATLTATDPSTNTVMGQLDVQVGQVPASLVGPTRNLQNLGFSDCPDPSLPVTDTFGVNDSCGNPLLTLSGSGSFVSGTLVPQQVAFWTPTPPQGAIASPGSRSAFSSAPLVITEPGATPGQFAVQYQAPTCTLAGLAYRPQLVVSPSWNSAAAQTIPLQLSPCSGCSVQVFNTAGTAVNHLNRECDGRSDLVVTECVPVGTTAEVVIGRVAGTGMLSFARNGSSDRAASTFNAGTRGQTARLPLYIGTAQSGDQFRIAAFIPSQAAVQAGNGILCQSGLITVDTACSEILISPVADNPQAVPSNLPADATVLCAADGTPVYFRVKDCDQNTRNWASDDIRNTAGTGRGLLVQVVAADGTVVDTEGPNLLEANVHGGRAIDSPYFQGNLAVTRDPADASFSGLLKVPGNRVVTLRAVYRDPDDPSDSLCVAEALLVPPLPVCFPLALASLGDWAGDLRVHWGDALVGGRLDLPAPPLLVAKSQTASLAPAPYGPGALDRYFNAYVGGTIRVGGFELTPQRPPPFPLDQPFLANGAGAAFSTTEGNYLQAVADPASLATKLDYDSLKLIARARKVYWVPEPAGTLFNPETLRRGTFEQITALPGPGRASATHDGHFLFVDAPAGLQSASAIAQAPVQSLPTHAVSSDYYTEGFLYVAGSVAFRSASGQQEVPTAVASSADARYDENSAALARQDLPIDFAPAPAPLPTGRLSVNLNGALYGEGRVELADGFRVYGAVVAARGGTSGSADVWYDARWRADQPALCSQCCALSISPNGAAVALAGTLQMSAAGGRGAVVWESLAPQVAAVDQTGQVSPAAVGRVTIRVTDSSGCVAESEVEVF